MLRTPQKAGLLFFGVPLTLTKEHIVSINVPVQLPEWRSDYLYQVGAMVSRAGKSFLAVLSEAHSYKRDCQALYNLDKDPAIFPPLYVPMDNPKDPPQDRCIYSQAGKSWWVEINSSITYGESLFNYNEYSKVEVLGPITMTIAPPRAYDMIGLFGLEAASATLTVGGETETRDLELKVRLPGIDAWPYSRHSNRTVWLLEEPTTQPFSLTVSPLHGRSALGNLVVALRNDFGVTDYYSSVGIRDYSRKGYDDFGRSILVPRWYQDLVNFKVTVPAEKRLEVRDVLAQNRATPCLYVGHDDPEQYALQVFGLMSDVYLPLTNAVQSVLELEVESVGVPKLVSGSRVDSPAVPDTPETPIRGPWLAVGHDNEPYLTIINTLRWQAEELKFEIPGPARAVLFSIDQEYLFIGHDCPPYLTVVSTYDWEVIDITSPSSNGDVGDQQQWQPLDFLPTSDSYSSSSSSGYSDSDSDGPIEYPDLYSAGTVYSLAQSPDESQLAIAHNCPPYLTVLRVGHWNKVNRRMPALQRGSVFVDFTRDSRYLLVSDFCHWRFYFDVQDYSTRHDLVGRGMASMFSNDRLWVVLGYDGSTEVSLPSYSDMSSEEQADYGPRLELYRMSNLSVPVRTLSLPGNPYVIKQSGDGKYIAVGHKCAPYLTMIDGETFTEIDATFNLKYGACSVEFSSDSQYLAVSYKHKPYVSIIELRTWLVFDVSYVVELEDVS